MNTIFCTCGSVHSFQDQLIDDAVEALNETVDPQERIRLMRTVGDFCFDAICSLPMFDVRPDIAVNPKFVKHYFFPGFISGFYTHLEYIETVPQ